MYGVAHGPNSMKHTPRTAQMRVGWIGSLIVQTQFDLHSYSSLVLRTRPVHLGIFAFFGLFRPQSSLSRPQIKREYPAILVIDNRVLGGDSPIHTCTSTE